MMEGRQRVDAARANGRDEARKEREEADERVRSGRSLQCVVKEPRAPAVARLRENSICYDSGMSTANAVLDELLEPIGACLTPEVAERIATLRAPELVQARMEELARKSDEGSLSDSEREEYDVLVSAGNFIAILQSKARKLLRARPA